MAVESDGNVLVGDDYGLRRVSPDAHVTSIFRGMNVREVDSRSGLTLYSTGSTIVSLASTGSSTTIASGFGFVQGIAVASPALFYVADSGRSTIEKVSLQNGVWSVSRVAGTQGTCGFKDGIGSQAQFCSPRGMTVDGGGNLYVADENNHAVRKVTPAGEVSTYVRQSVVIYPKDVAFDKSGNLLVVSPFGNIVSVAPNGTTSTVAGIFETYAATDGEGTVAQFYQPTSIAVNAAGDIFVADSYNYCIRVGRTALSDAAMIDSPAAAVGDMRQLGVASKSATSFVWSIKRQPTPSSATLSALNVENPTFVPDAAGLYEFELRASSAAGDSITSVALNTTCVAPPSAPSISRISGPQSTCVGESVTLQANIAGGSVFAWSTGANTATITVTPDVTTTYTLVQFDENGCESAAATYTHTVDPCVVTPQNLSIYVISPTQLNLVWSQVAGVTYEVWRTTDGTHWDVIATPGSYLIDTVAAKPYLYKVRAVHPTAGASGFSAAKFVNQTTFAESPFTGSTIKASHFVELRGAVNSVRALAGLPATIFTDATLDSTVVMKREHILELRTAVAEARSALGLAPATFTDSTLISGVTVMKAAHLYDLRNALK